MKIHSGVLSISLMVTAAQRQVLDILQPGDMLIRHFFFLRQTRFDALLAFYDFPAEHWKHLRTSNSIESTFATVRHRTIRSKGCLSNTTAFGMVFKLVEAAQKSWRRLDGHKQLPKVVLGAKFSDGLEVVGTADRQTKAAA